MLAQYSAMVPIVLLWLVAATTNSEVHAVPTTTFQPNASTTPAQETLKDFEKKIDQLVATVTKMVLPIFVENSDAKLSSQCTGSIIKIFSDIRRLRFTALKLLDSMGKPVSGMFEGAFAMMGDYEECLSIRVPKRRGPIEKPEDELFHGTYCTLGFRLPSVVVETIENLSDGLINGSQLGKLRDVLENIPLKSFAREYFEYNIGVCVPSTCSLEDLKTMIDLAGVPVLTEVKRCESKRPVGIAYDQIAVITFIAILALLIVIGTTLETVFYLRDPNYNGHHEGKGIQFLLAFALYNNTKKFMRTEKDTPAEVTCINGMYITGTFLVVVYHTYFVPFLHYVYRHSSHIDEYFRDFSFTLISTMSISIEAYFLFSGFFLVYSRWVWAGDRKLNINVPRLIFQRYLRLAPSMLFIVGLILLLPLFGNGPIWEDIFGVAAQNTRKWWWQYVLMIHNFLVPKEQNFLYLWFIPCLMQITIGGIILAWLMSKSLKLGITAIVLVSVACNAVLGVLTYQRNYPASFAIYFLQGRQNFEIPVYTSPLSHVSSFGIGMILGYYMSKRKTLKMKPVTVVVGWIVCLALTVGTQLVLYVCHDGKQPSALFSAIYAATHRTAFSIGMVWLIVACSNGYGGVMGKLMCWRGFGPLSKLGYSGYLVHYLVIAYHISIARTPMMYSHFEIWMRIAAYNAFTFALGFVMYITFELPLKFLEAHFFGRRPETKANHAATNGIDKISDKAKNNGTVVYAAPVEPVWVKNQTFKDSRSENSRL